MGPNPQFPADLVTFTKEVLIENFIFCAVQLFIRFNFSASGCCCSNCCRISRGIGPFQVNVPFLDPLKTLGKQVFYFFRGPERVY